MANLNMLDLPVNFSVTNFSQLITSF